MIYKQKYSKKNNPIHPLHEQYFRHLKNKRIYVKKTEAFTLVLKNK